MSYISIHDKFAFGFNDLNNNGMFDVQSESLTYKQKTFSEVEEKVFLAQIGLTEQEVHQPIQASHLYQKWTDSLEQRAHELITQHIISKQPFGAIFHTDLPKNISFEDSAAGIERYIAAQAHQAELEQFQDQHPIYFIAYYNSQAGKEGTRSEYLSPNPHLGNLKVMMTLSYPFDNEKAVVNLPKGNISGNIQFELFGYNKDIGCAGVSVFTKTESNTPFDALYFQGTKYLFDSPYKYTEYCGF